MTTIDLTVENTPTQTNSIPINMSLIIESHRTTTNGTAAEAFTVNKDLSNELTSASGIGHQSQS